MKNFSLLLLSAAVAVGTLSVSAKKPPFAYHAPNPKVPIEAPTVTYGKALLQGKIFGWQPDLPMPELQEYTMFDDEPTMHSLNVAPDGTFSIEATNAHTWRVFFGSSSFLAMALLSPGKTTTVYIDLPSAKRSASFLNEKENDIQYAWFEGAYAQVNNDINRLGHRAPFYEEFYPTSPASDSLFASGTMDQIVAWLYAQYKQSAQDLAALRIAPSTRAFFEAQIKAQLLYSFAFTDYLAANAYRNIHQTDRPKGKQLTFEAKHFEPLKAMQLNTLEFAIFGDPNPYIFDTIGASINQKEPLAGIKTFFGPSVLDDVAQARVYAHKLNVLFEPLTDQELQTLSSAAILPSLGAMAAEKNAALLAQLEANKTKTGYTICQAPTMNDSTLFDALMAPYAGKVVFVDFWATWCSPCRSAMKDAEPVKAALQGKEVAYVYLTSPSSPMDTWNKLIPNIHGHHYMLTKEQWKTLCDQFGVQGIPSYVVVGRDGKVKHFQTGFMGASKMKELLEKEL